jgi:uncharacterized membrane protein
MRKLRLAFLSTILSTLVFAQINSSIDLPTKGMLTLLDYNPEVLAKSKSSGGSSGGRSRGGSFNRSAPSNSNSQPSSGGGSNNNSQPNSQPRNNPQPQNQPNYNNNYNYNNNSRPNTYVNPVIVGNNNRSDDEGVFLIFLLLLGGVGAIGLLIWWLSRNNKGSSAAGGGTELANEVVTVTCLQIALLATAREVQKDLADLATESDLSTPEGLATQLRESILILMRSPETWTHARSTSRTVQNLKEAEVLFEQMSITERSKFSDEVIVNNQGKIKNKAYTVDPDAEPAAYIVATLLVATADDKPLFPDVRTEEDLKTALARMAAVSPEYLMVFELLWTPAAEDDSLSYDQLLANYADMGQLI